MVEKTHNGTILSIMGPLRKKSWWQKLLTSRLTLVVLMVVSVGLSFAVYDRYVVEREMAARRESKEVELLRESERHSVLKEKVDYLNNEQGMEAEIRRHFDVAMEGEQVVVIVGEKEVVGGDNMVSNVISAEEESPSFWRRIFSW